MRLQVVTYVVGLPTNEQLETMMDTMDACYESSGKAFSLSETDRKELTEEEMSIIKEKKNKKPYVGEMVGDTSKFPTKSVLTKKLKTDMQPDYIAKK